MSNLSENLLEENIPESKYVSKEKYQDHIFEQYKLYVESSDRVSARRYKINTFFLTLHTLIIGIVGFLYEKGPKFEQKWIILIPLIAVLVLCFSWWRFAKTYRQLNSAKFKVIGELEKHLPFSPIWSAEWKALGAGMDSKLYRPFTGVETGVPLIFAFLYIVGILYPALSRCKKVENHLSSAGCPETPI